MLQKIRKSLMQKGQSVVEYTLLLGFVAVITVGLVSGDDENSFKSIFKSALGGIIGQFTQFNDDYDGTSEVGAGEGEDYGDGSDLDNLDNDTSDTGVGSGTDNSGD